MLNNDSRQQVLGLPQAAGDAADRGALPALRRLGRDRPLRPGCGGVHRESVTRERRAALRDVQRVRGLGLGALP